MPSEDSGPGILREYAIHDGMTVAIQFVDAETAKTAGRSGLSEMVRYLQREQKTYA